MSDRNIEVFRIYGCEFDNCQGKQAKHYLAVDVGFCKAGTNWFNGNPTPGGYSLTFSKREDDGGGSIMFVMDGRSNPARVLRGAKRFSKLTLAALADMIRKPDAKIEALILETYERAREVWPEAKFPVIEPGTWAGMIAGEFAGGR